MKDFTTDSSSDELGAYVILYYPHCHAEETDEDKVLIVSNDDKETYKWIHKVNCKDNNY